MRWLFIYLYNPRRDARPTPRVLFPARKRPMRPCPMHLLLTHKNCITFKHTETIHILFSMILEVGCVQHHLPSKYIVTRSLVRFKTGGDAAEHNFVSDMIVPPYLNRIEKLCESSRTEFGLLNGSRLYPTADLYEKKSNWMIDGSYL